MVSPITLLEIGAVLSRSGISFDAPDFLSDENTVRRIVAVSEYFIERLALRIESPQVTSKIRIGRTSLSMPLEYSEALKQAGELKLRALDLLHLAYASLISSLRTRIDRFVTSDKGILDRSRAIEDQLGIKSIHPADIGR